jgi:hypothetical protein
LVIRQQELQAQGRSRMTAPLGCAAFAFADTNPTQL